MVVYFTFNRVCVCVISMETNLFFLPFFILFVPLHELSCRRHGIFKVFALNRIITAARKRKQIIVCYTWPRDLVISSARAVSVYMCIRSFPKLWRTLDVNTDSLDMHVPRALRGDFFFFFLWEIGNLSDISKWAYNALQLVASLLVITQNIVLYSILLGYYRWQIDIPWFF